MFTRYIWYVRQDTDQHRFGAIAPARPSPSVGSIFVDGIRLLVSVVHRLLNQRNHSQLLESNTASIIMGDYGKVPVVPLAQFGNVDR